MTADLLHTIRADDAVDNLRMYFGEDVPHRYTGRRFEALAGGGDRCDTRDVIAADDLVAVQMLSVTVPAEVAVDLLDGELGQRVTALLSEIPTGVALGTSPASTLIADGGHADRAWHLLRDQAGIGYTIAGKLMARKRPHLLPVYDRVVACLFGHPDHVWLRLHDRLTDDGGTLRDQLDGLRTRAGIPATVSLLRVLDVILWMSHHNQHQARDCPGNGTVALSLKRSLSTYLHLSG